MSKSLEELYASPEMEEAFEMGKRAALREHKCPKVEVRTKIVERARKPHLRSRTKRWGVVNNGKLLNPTFDTEAEAAVWMMGLVPANPAMRGKVKLDAIAVDLGSHFSKPYPHNLHPMTVSNRVKYDPVLWKKYVEANRALGYEVGPNGGTYKIKKRV